MQCPICNGVARDRTPPDYEGIVIGCVSCGNYEIARGYVDKIRALDPSARSEILRKAKHLAKFAGPSIDGRCF